MISPKFFPGNNTAWGFYSFFKELLNSYEYKFIIKGGPGTGKSTLMKKIAEKINMKFNKELFFCASDSESLDAVGFPELKTILIDGTSPHKIDPSFPGAGEYLVDLGKYLDQEKLIPVKKNLVDTQELVKTHYEIAYSYFWQAREALNREIMLSKELNSFEQASNLEKEKIIEDLNNYPPKTKTAFKRSLFLRGYTPEGICSLANNFIDNQTKLFSIIGNISAANELFKYIESKAFILKHPFEVYYHPLEPTLIEGIRFPHLNIIYLLKESYPEISNIDNGLHIQIEIPFTNHNEKVQKFKKRQLFKALEQKKCLVNEGLIYLYKMKKIRAELESYYSSAQDFNGIEKTREKIIEKINTLVQEH